MKTLIGFALMAVVLALSPGCASIIGGTTQTITVESTPPGATCRFYREGKVVANVVTPGGMTVEKTKHDLTVECEKEGYETTKANLDSEIEDSTWGNIILGGGIGWAIDSASGADNKYPEYVNATLVPVPVQAQTPVPAPQVQQHSFSQRTAAPSAPAPSPQGGPGEAEMAYWRAVSESDDPEAYRAYLQTYPDGHFAPIARVRAKATSEEVPEAVPTATPQIPQTFDEPADPNGVWEASLMHHGSMSPNACSSDSKVLLVVQNYVVVGQVEVLRSAYTDDELANKIDLTGAASESGELRASGDGAAIWASVTSDGKMIEGDWNLYECRGAFRASRRQ